jgi:hypothetical protein
VIKIFVMSNAINFVDFAVSVMKIFDMSNTINSVDDRLCDENISYVNIPEFHRRYFVSVTKIFDMLNS